jgi:EAL domain-containing protein (putative c-di-GMP-specific phosphodiesterase class I)
MSYVNEAGGIVCRSGADTFMLYCIHTDDYTALLASLSACLDDDSIGNNRVRLRMGVYVNADKTVDIERRFDRAKMAADTARNHLTAPIGFFDHSMREAEILEEQLIDGFHAALREKQFVVFYQPKYDVKHDIPVLSSAEALVRWKHPELGMISPGVFIPLLERNALIEKVDVFVWEEAARQVAAWKKKYGVTIPVSINLSRLDVFNPELETILDTLVKGNGLEREDLKLEVTESAYTENADQVIRVIESLREKGYEIEMDDFGSGYSSLNMLSSMPVDVLKMDRAFIQDVEHSEKDVRLVELVLNIAKNLKVPVIAEGVETEEQLQLLKGLGCDVIQGFYFSRPLPADQFEEQIIQNEISLKAIDLKAIYQKEFEQK